MSVLCLGGRTTGMAIACDCVKSFLAVKFTGAERPLRRLAKVSAIRTHPILAARTPAVPNIGDPSVLAINNQAEQ